MTTPVQLSIRNLSKRYKTGEGVTGISFDIHHGELVTLLGPSGCGKTTVLRSVGGFLEPDSGDILIAGKSVLHLPPEKRPTAMVFQSYNLWPHMNVFENLAFGLKIRKMKKDQIQEAVDRALKLVRLPGAEKKRPTELSGGQQQRVAVARALLLEPEVLLLDEPFSALDAKLRAELREELREIQSSTKLTMMFVTHDQEEALSLSDRIIVMNRGHIEQSDSPQAIYDAPQTLFVANFIGRMNMLEGVAHNGSITLQNLELPDSRHLHGDVVIAVRPEDVRWKDASFPGLAATVKQVMVLGHYAEITLLTEAGVLRMFLPREEAVELSGGQSVSLTFSKHAAYPKISA
ncbi:MULTISPECIES: ABC transporter ATP-binding protein [Paenibacillus]|uniref:ABC transporter ATP-binding protein n=1 Tax=Paenibacillus TaxID=44249 RepID=UPI001C1F6D89|nr:ABC transporter ATP-binding protein [Paenibacillus oleatilyticus]MBU7314674.1 ABC transporter ATP-binding protein [Paenibacillus oleatilyticus]GMX66658.1 ABC transporter ATP-binding protein [Paenibacillus elgii]